MAKEHIGLITFFPVLFILASLFFLPAGTLTGNENGAVSKNTFATSSTRTKAPVDPFYNISLEAESAYVLDVKNNKTLFSKNGEKKLPLASLTKIMSAIVLREHFGEGHTIQIDSNALTMEGDNGLFINEKWDIGDLLSFSLITSSNDGIRAATKSFEETTGTDMIRLMNEKARTLSLAKTHFLNETGLDVTPTLSGSYGTAHDVSTLLKYAYERHGELLYPTRYKERRITSLNFGEHVVKNTNNIVDKLPSVLGGKTGFTDLAGGNLAVLFEKEPGWPIIVVALGSSTEGRFSDVEKLVWASIVNYDK